MAISHTLSNSRDLVLRVHHETALSLSLTGDTDSHDEMLVKIDPRVLGGDAYHRRMM